MVWLSLVQQSWSLWVNESGGFFWVWSSVLSKDGPNADEQTWSGAVGEERYQ